MLLNTTGKSYKATQKQEFVIKKLFPYTASYIPVFLSGGCKNSLRLIHRCDLYMKVFKPTVHQMETKIKIHG